MHELLEDTIKKDGIVHSYGIRRAISKDLIIKIQGTKERVGEIA